MKYTRNIRIAVTFICLLGSVGFVNALTISPVKLELSGDPGSAITGEFELFNEEKETKTLYSSFANFEARGESGSPYFLSEKSGLSTWITTQPSIILDSGERMVVPYSINIPQNVEPGGYFAAIFWGTSPPESQDGGQVSIGGKLGILVLLTVSGETEQGGGLLSFSLAENKKVTTGFPMIFSYRFSNDGAVRIKPDGEIIVKNVFGGEVVKLQANSRDGNVLPKSIRKFDVVWLTKNQEKSTNPSLPNNEEELGFFETVGNQVSNFALGPYTAQLNLIYGSDQQTVQKKFLFFVIPWQLLLIVLIIILILVFGLKRYNHWIISRHKTHNT
ncbi:MAG: hypothetical protein WC705_00575 [Candidatus Paceibacterota bacterium]|jgi:hypothetical protein